MMAGLMRKKMWVWKGIRSRSKCANVMPLTIFWTVWKEMNKKAFDGVNDVNGFNVLNNR